MATLLRCSCDVDCALWRRAYLRWCLWRPRLSRPCFALEPAAARPARLSLPVMTQRLEQRGGPCFCASFTCCIPAPINENKLMHAGHFVQCSSFLLLHGLHIPYASLRAVCRRQPICAAFTVHDVFLQGGGILAAHSDRHGAGAGGRGSGAVCAQPAVAAAACAGAGAARRGALALLLGARPRKRLVRQIWLTSHDRASPSFTFIAAF